MNGKFRACLFVLAIIGLIGLIAYLIYDHYGPEKKLWDFSDFDQKIEDLADWVEVKTDVPSNLGGSIDLVSEVEQVTNLVDLQITVQVEADPEAKTLEVFNNNISVASLPLAQETLTVPITLNQGDNSIVFELADANQEYSEILETVEVYLDNVPPEINSEFCQANNEFDWLELETWEERICVSVGRFNGKFPAVFPFPITGYVFGQVDEILLEGESLTISEGYINQEINLYADFGEQFYQITAKDLAGNKIIGEMRLNLVTNE